MYYYLFNATLLIGTALFDEMCTPIFLSLLVDPLYDSVRRVELDSVDVSCKQGDVILGDNQMKNTLTGDNSYWTSRTPRSNDARNGHANGAVNGAANGVDCDGANGHVNIFREHHEDGKKV